MAVEATLLTLLNSNRRMPCVSGAAVLLSIAAFEFSDTSPASGFQSSSGCVVKLQVQGFCCCKR